MWRTSYQKQLCISWYVITNQFVHKIVCFCVHVISYAILVLFLMTLVGLEGSVMNMSISSMVAYQ